MITYKVTLDFEGTKRWYNEKNEFHRLDGPAVDYPTGRNEWWVNGKLHRLDGPAIECSNGDKWWYQNGKLHRLDGPVVEWPDGTKEWWVEGCRYTEEEFKAKIEAMNRPCIGKKIVVEGVEYTLV